MLKFVAVVKYCLIAATFDYQFKSKHNGTSIIQSITTRKVDDRCTH